MRTIVADMLLNMNDKLMLTNRDVKTIQGELAHINSKVHETNIKLDREAKIKDLVESLKMKITGLVSSAYNLTVMTLMTTTTISKS